MGAGLPTSTSTPVLDKKPLKELNLLASRGAGDTGSVKTTSHSIIGKPDTNLSVAKQRSFDVETSLGIGGCYSNYGHENLRTRPPKQAPAPTLATQSAKEHASDIARSCSFTQRREAFQVNFFNLQSACFFCFSPSARFRFLLSFISKEGFGLKNF